MAAQALYLRWRPATFEQVVGQQHITQTLSNAIQSGRVSHAYLFSGPRGTGKTSTARLLAKAVNCLAEDAQLRPDNTCRHCVDVNAARFMDLIEIDAASHTGVDDVRDLRDRIAFAPTEGGYKVYIIDEVHRFSAAAFDALLKTLEEPPEHAIFILATTEIHKVPATILSRCQRFDFRRISPVLMVEHMAYMAEQEGFQAEAGALEVVARQATGSLRDAISLLDQLVAGPGDVLTTERVHAALGTVLNEGVSYLVETVLTADAAGGLDYINQTIEESADPRQFARQVVDYLRSVMLVRSGSETLVAAAVSQDILQVIAGQASEFSHSGLIEAIRAFNQAAHDTRSGWLPQLPLEMALMESIAAQHTQQGAQPAPVASEQIAPVVSESTAQATPVEQVVAPQVSHSSELTLADISGSWKAWLTVAKKFDKKAPAMLRAGKPISVKDGVLTMGVQSDLMKEKIESQANRRMLEDALQEVFGVPLTIECRVQDAARSSESEEVSDLIANDSVIATAVNDLGGEISEIQSGSEET